MPGYTIEATIRASARFTLHIEADGEEEARAWTRELLAPLGLSVDGALYEDPLDADEGAVEIESLERSDLPTGTRVVAAGVPSQGSWSRPDG